MTTFGVTASGFVTKRLADIDLEISAALQAAFGAGVDLSEESPLGQIKGIIAEREALIWELAEAVYLSAYPDTASGVSLDNAVALTGVTRKAQTYSKVTGATFTGTPGTPIPAGSVVQVSGNAAALFTTDADVTIGGGGTVTGNLTAETAGAIAAPAGSLTVIKTAVAGWSAVTNAADAVVGQATESDTTLKLRRAASLQKAGASTLQAIEAALLGVPSVTAVLIFENITMAVDANSRPAKSFETVIEGGDDQTIANTIWSEKPAGIQTYGQVTKTVTDSQGNPQSVSFSRPTAVPIYVAVTLQTTALYPADGDTTVVAQILAYAATLTLGSSVIPVPGMIAFLANIPGIVGATINVGTSASPTMSDNISVEQFQLATFDASRITVTP